MVAVEVAGAAVARGAAAVVAAAAEAAVVEAAEALEDALPAFSAPWDAALTVRPYTAPCLTVGVELHFGHRKRRSFWLGRFLSYLHPALRALIGLQLRIN